jgi:two pore calcium channel protein
LYILALLALLVVFYGWFGVVLFYGTEQGKRDFSNLIEGCWTLWICITTANYPDVMMPSYNENRLSAIFFVSFMIISFFFLMNLILATVVNAYDAAIEERKKSRKDLAYRNLTKAFHLMDPHRTGRIDRDTIMAVFFILNADFPEFRTLSGEETKLLFGFLDRDGTSTITLDEFQDFGSVLLLDFAKASEYATFVETHFPQLYKSPGYQMFCDGVRSKYFEYAVDIILVLNAVVIGIQSYPELSGQPIEMDPHFSDGYIDTVWELIETLFTIIYAVEVFIKVMVDGWRTYRESPRNMFDFVVTLLAIVATAYVYYPNAYSDSRLIRFIVMVRVIRLVRILNAIKQFQLIGSISAEIMPAAASVIMFLFFLMYIFAAIGMLMYGGMITRDPSNPLSYAILENDFSDNDYWANNFNDMLSGLNVLFNLLVVNNWTNCEIGFEAVTGGKMVRFFFLGFHILGVILVNNLVIAFIINAFFQQLETVYTRSGEDIVQGEAIIRGQRAMFDASEVTGTKTGATGGYIARIRTVHRDVEVDEREGLRRLFTQQSSNGSDKE